MVSSILFDLPQVVVIKAPIDLVDQFGGGLQVDLRGMDIHVAHIGRKPREPGVYILSVPIPGEQSVMGEGVTIIPCVE